MDSRPSELDPYPRAQRDMGSAVLWDKSLHRSRRRRMRVRDARRNAPRQKGVTLAAGAAILASPVLTVASVASASSARPGVTKAEIAQKAVVVGGDQSATALLSYGDTGEAVAAVQAELQIAADGIFGPQTEGAVKNFQLAQRMTVTGVVDAKTWAALFASDVRFFDSASASTAGAGAEADVVFADAPLPAAGADGEELDEAAPGGTEGGSPGGPDGGSSGGTDGAAPPDSSTGADPAPGATQPAPVAAPKRVPATGSGCTADGRLVTPVNGTVTSGYGDGRNHAGVDIAAPTGTTVRAAQCGTVSMSGTESGYGSMICIRHAGETTTCYAHLSQRDVSVNEYVKAGQKIGEVGCTGRCTGPHTHFEVRQGGTAQNPSPYLAGSRTVAAKTATTAAGGIGGPTEAEQAATFGTTTGGTEAPAPTTAPAAAPAPAPVAEAPAPVAEAPAAPVRARRGTGSRRRGTGAGGRGTRSGRRGARRAGSRARRRGTGPVAEAPAPVAEAPAPVAEAPVAPGSRARRRAGTGSRRRGTGAGGRGARCAGSGARRGARARCRAGAYRRAVNRRCRGPGCRGGRSGGLSRRTGGAPRGVALRQAGVVCRRRPGRGSPAHPTLRGRRRTSTAAG